MYCTKPGNSHVKDRPDAGVWPSAECVADLNQPSRMEQPLSCASHQILVREGRGSHPISVADPCCHLQKGYRAGAKVQPKLVKMSPPLQSFSSPMHLPSVVLDPKEDCLWWRSYDMHHLLDCSFFQPMTCLCWAAGQLM